MDNLAVQCVFCGHRTVQCVFCGTGVVPMVIGGSVIGWGCLWCGAKNKGMIAVVKVKDGTQSLATLYMRGAHAHEEILCPEGCLFVATSEEL